MTDPYRRSARGYDRVIGPLDQGLRRVVLELHPPSPGWRVLDVGCGTGTGLVPYVDAGCSAVGVDVSPAMLEQARQRLGDGAELHLADGGVLPFDDDSFDLVLTTMVLQEEAAADRVAFLTEMARVAKPTAMLQIVDFRFGSLRGWRGPVFKVLNVIIERFGGHYAGFKSFKAGGGATPVMKAAGLSIEREKVVAGGNLAIYLATST